MRFPILTLLFVLLLSGIATGQSSVKYAKANIKTSAQCEMCKATIEKAVNQVKGVSASNLDITTRRLRVRFDPKSTNIDAIRRTVAQVGYDADNVAAVPAQYDALPQCCKKGEDCTPEAMEHGSKS